jgi:hypothetical protein
MSMERLPFEHRPRNSIANNLDRINELVDWVNLDTHLYASANGERVTVDDASSFKCLTVDGRSVQNGTPTPDAPVPVQVVEGPLSLVIGDASVPIDLQGNTLASLPDGTRNELHIDSAGRVWIYKRVDRILTPTDVSNVNGLTQVPDGARWNIDVDGLTSKEIPNGSTNGYCSHTPFSRTLALGSLGSHVFTFGGKLYYVIEGDFTASTAVTWVNLHQMTIIYPLATPQTIDLGYITPPAIPSGSVVTVSASLTPTIHLDWWVDDGITALVNDLIAYVDHKTEG